MKKVPIPTDKELKESIEDLKLQLALMENMLKLNDEGREKVVIYMFGLLNFDEFRRGGELSADSSENGAGGIPPDGEAAF